MICREPTAAAETTFDLIVIGAGIYGAAATLEASRRGLRVLVIDRADFGGETSWNSLRVLHGGLRYLQTLDLVRFRESVRARSWYVSEFPSLIEPLECLMPLYGRGMRRTATLRPVLAASELLRRLWSSPAAIQRIQAGLVVENHVVTERFPGVESSGLRGGAIWYDGYIPQPQRVLIEMLRRATATGAVALNYVEATGWIIEAGRIGGVRAHDRLTDTQMSMRSRAVLNCAGPWAADLAASETTSTEIMFAPTLAFNLLLDRQLPSDVTVAVEPAGGGRTYFLHPRGRTTLAGTFHVPAESPDSQPAEHQILEFLGDLSAAIPGFDVARDQVLRILPGILPAKQAQSDEPATRDLWIDHGAVGGSDGLFTLIGTKYTMAPLAAKRAVDRIVERCLAKIECQTAVHDGEPETRSVPNWAELMRSGLENPVATSELLRSLIEQESVTSMDDLLLRRADWGLVPSEYHEAEGLVRKLCPEFLDSAHDRRIP